MDARLVRFTRKYREDASGAYPTEPDPRYPSWAKYHPTFDLIELDPYYIESKSGKRLADVAHGAWAQWQEDPAVPTGLVTTGLKTYVGYQDGLWVTEEDISVADFLALVNEKENRKRLRLQKAHALQEMADRLREPGQRQRIPSEIKLAVWRRDQGTCVVCGSNQELEFDHIIPLSMGGSNTERNLQLLCAACNRRKGAVLGGEDPQVV